MKKSIHSSIVFIVTILALKSAFSSSNKEACMIFQTKHPGKKFMYFAPAYYSSDKPNSNFIHQTQTSKKSPAYGYSQPSTIGGGSGPGRTRSLLDSLPLSMWKGILQGLS
ncbi:MAG: hypothetical protein H6696_17695 [Deferribacteres bacterium]|nr:hypothetical protein [Deferribacteres bacterium]